jgi:hypothetical protein
MAYQLPDLRIGAALEAMLERLERRKANGDFEYQSAVDTDPFAALIEMSQYGLGTLSEWWEAFEGRRRWQKAMTNELGDLQQDIIGNIPGWCSNHPEHDTDVQPDVVGSFGSQGIIAEVKNKYNTMNDGAGKSVYDKLAASLDTKPEYDGFVAVVIQFIRPQNSRLRWRQYCPGDRPARDDIVVMGGRAFYALATDPHGRGINRGVQATDSMTGWDSWSGIDQMAEQFFSAIEARIDSHGLASVRQAFTDQVTSSLRS